jgi:hypothetical protein
MRLFSANKPRSVFTLHPASKLRSVFTLHPASKLRSVFTLHPVSKLRRFITQISDENGSAVVEFVVLALPLFIPVIIFLAHFASLSDDQFIVRTLARESIRSYILSANDLSAMRNAQETMRVGARELGLDPARIDDLKLGVDCKGIFCISPDNKVELTISLPSKDGKRFSIASARETVSPWV